jgi:hypothetical protein
MPTFSNELLELVGALAPVFLDTTDLNQLSRPPLFFELVALQQLLQLEHLSPPLATRGFNIHGAYFWFTRISPKNVDILAITNATGGCCAHKSCTCEILFEMYEAIRFRDRHADDKDEGRRAVCRCDLAWREVYLGETYEKRWMTNDARHH